MSEALDFTGRIAIVTGGGRGLGRTHCLALATRGAVVIVNDVGSSLSGEPGEPGAAQVVVDEIRSAGGLAVADDTSITEEGGPEAIVKRVVDEYGKLDILINNAGFLRDRSFAKMTLDDFDSVIDVHLRGTYLMGKAAWSVFRENGYGRIVNTTSVAGLLGNFGQANYGAAKAGIVGLTKVQAIEGERNGIVSNVIEPAARTRMTDGVLADFGDRLNPKYVSAAVVVLAHELCPVNGEVVNAGGGRVAKVILAETQGYYDEDANAESVFANWSVVEDTTDLAFPATFAEEFELLTKHYRPNE